MVATLSINPAMASPLFLCGDSERAKAGLQSMALRIAGDSSAVVIEVEVFSWVKRLL
jgi:hypothetical protein